MSTTDQLDEYDKDLVGRCSNRPQHHGIFDIPQHHKNCEGPFHTREEAKPTIIKQTLCFMIGLKLKKLRKTSKFDLWTTKLHNKRHGNGTENNKDSTVKTLPPKNCWGCARKTSNSTEG